MQSPMMEGRLLCAASSADRKVLKDRTRWSAGVLDHGRNSQ